MTDEQFLEYAISEYDTGYLPCDGITINCTKILNIEQECEYEYDINHEQLNLTKYLNPNIIATCY